MVQLEPNWVAAKVVGLPWELAVEPLVFSVVPLMADELVDEGVDKVEDPVEAVDSVVETRVVDGDEAVVVGLAVDDVVDVVDAGAAVVDVVVGLAVVVVVSLAVVVGLAVDDVVDAGAAVVDVVAGLAVVVGLAVVAGGRAVVEVVGAELRAGAVDADVPAVGPVGLAVDAVTTAVVRVRTEEEGAAVDRLAPAAEVPGAAVVDDDGSSGALPPAPA